MTWQSRATVARLTIAGLFLLAPVAAWFVHTPRVVDPLERVATLALMGIALVAIATAGWVARGRESSPAVRFFCVYCAASEGEPHPDWCPREGEMRGGGHR